MKKELFFLLLIIYNLQLLSQNLEWVKTIGGEYSDELTGLVVDSEGNIYSTGYFTGTVDFDPNGGVFELIDGDNESELYYSQDLFIQKWSPSGDLIWAVNSHISKIDIGTSITLDSFNNVIISGIIPFEGSGFGYSNTIIKKFDTDGNEMFTKTFGNYDQTMGRAVITDSNNNIYITGDFQNVVDFDPGIGAFNLDANGGVDIFILKLDSEGNFLWVKNFDGSDLTISRSMNIDSLGNLYICGFFSETCDFDPGSSSSNSVSLGEWDAYIVKLDNDGNLIWNKSFGSENIEDAGDVVIDNLGNVYITGSFTNTVDFDPNSAVFNLTAEGESDLFLLKLDIDGNFLWANQYESESYGYGSSVDLDLYDNVYISGLRHVVYSYGSGGNMNVEGYDIIVQKYQTDGALMWTKIIGGTDQEFAYGMAIDNLNNIIIGGYFDGTTDFDSSDEFDDIHTSNGYNDIFILKLNQDILPIANTINSLYGCDENNNGIYEFFDTTNIERDVLGGQTDMTVSYYDENGNTLPYPLPNPFTNNIPFSETIKVRVTNNQTSLFSETTFDLIVNPLPIANSLTDLIGCDDNNDGISEYFDTTNVESDVLNGQTGMDVSYYDYLGNQISLSNPYTNSISNIELITVRVTNTATLCFDETILTLKTSSQPQINQPNTIYACDEGDGVSHFDTSLVETQLIGSQLGLTIIYTDTNGIILPSPLPNLFQNTESWFQTINVRVENELNSLCYSETSFDLEVNQLPIINLEAEYRLCDLEPSLYLSSDTSFYSWQWSYEDGSVLSNTFEVNISNDGTYTLTVEKLENGIICSSIQSFELIRSVLPQIEHVEYKELSENNSIEIIAIGDGDFEYSIDGINYQDSNLFEYLLGGIYTVYVQDKNGCGQDSEEVVIIDYPKFFTPNNDGENDKWQIKGMLRFPDAQVNIYDRFGKIIYIQLNNNDAWDGYYNGSPLPSADYWFSADFGNGKVFNGHFSLIRR